MSGIFPFILITRSPQIYRKQYKDVRIYKCYGSNIKLRAVIHAQGQFKDTLYEDRVKTARERDRGQEEGSQARGGRGDPQLHHRGGSQEDRIRGQRHDRHRHEA